MVSSLQCYAVEERLDLLFLCIVRGGCGKAKAVAQLWLVSLMAGWSIRVEFLYAQLALSCKTVDFGRDQSGKHATRRGGFTVALGRQGCDLHEQSASVSMLGFLILACIHTWWPGTVGAQVRQPGAPRSGLPGMEFRHGRAVWTWHDLVTSFWLPTCK